MEYKDGIANGDNEVDLEDIKGFCTTIEQILGAYWNVTFDEMMAIKRPIIGEVSLRRKKKAREWSQMQKPTFMHLCPIT